MLIKNSKLYFEKDKKDLQKMLIIKIYLQNL